MDVALTKGKVVLVAGRVTEVECLTLGCSKKKRDSFTSLRPDNARFCLSLG